MEDYNIKSIREDFKSKGVFYTQPKLAQYIKSLIDIEIKDVYDPTCGDGSLLACFLDNIPKFGQEINESQLNTARNRLCNFEGVCGDTLVNPAFLDKRFSCIVANPPFSIKWQPPSNWLNDSRFMYAPEMPPQSKADYAFLLHIIHLLDINGIAVVLNFPGVLYRGGKEGVLRKWFVDSNYIDKIIQIPTKSFIDTPIATVILVLKKNKINTDIEFIDNSLKLSKIVSIEDIKKNDYILSVNTYVFEDIKKEIINPIDLQQMARAQMIKKVKSDIEMDKFICEMEGYSFENYLKELRDLLDSY